MKHSNIEEILNKVNRREAFEEPSDQYFDDLKARVMSSIEKESNESQIQHQTVSPHRKLWVNIRPYVYMAAMFAGVWCMMNIFNLTQGLSNSNNAHTDFILAENLVDDNYLQDWYLDTVDESDIYDSLYDEGYLPEMTNDDI